MKRESREAGLADIEEVACACSTCVSMCERRACWPTPKDAAALLDAGLGDRMMLDFWLGCLCDTACDGDHDTEIVCPAQVGSEGSSAGLIPHGRCVMLTAAGRCSLHDRGLKPTEGRLALCKSRTTQPTMQLDLHELVARTWATPKGREVVARFRREVMEC